MKGGRRCGAQRRVATGMWVALPRIGGLLNCCVGDAVSASEEEVGLYDREE